MHRSLLFTRENEAGRTERKVVVYKVPDRSSLEMNILNNIHLSSYMWVSTKTFLE